MAASEKELAKEITVAVVSRLAEFSMDKFLERSRDVGRCAGEVYKEILRAIREENELGSR